MDNKGFLLRRSELFLGKGTHQTVVGRGAYMYTTTDAWDTYIKQENMGLQSWTGIDIHGSNPLIQTAVTVNGAIYTTQDAWDSFVLQSPKVTSAMKVAIAHSNPLIQTVVMRDSGFTPGYICTTNDGWKTTKTINVGTLAMMKIAISPTNPLIQTATAAGGILFITVDGWETFTNYEGIEWIDVAISSANPMVQTAVVAGGKILTTTDGWRTYTTRYTSSSVYFTSVAISFSNPLIQAAVAQGGTGRLFTTNDGWNTVTVRAIPELTGMRLWGIGIASDNSLIQSAADMDYNRVYATTDGWVSSPKIITFDSRLSEPRIAIA